MNKNSIIYIVAGSVLLVVGILGLYSKNKTPIKESANVAVDSTGGQLKITTEPIESNNSAIDNGTSSTDKIMTDKKMNKATIDTSFGKIVLEMYEKDAPKAVANFIALAQKGFYNNLTFHRVITGFMIQGGDPKGDGTGGPGYTFADELDENTPSAKAGYKKGVLAMANAGPNTNGSQFFIMLADYPLPHSYTIFGHVIFGQDVVDKIGAVKTGANDKPLSPVVMKSVTVSE